MRGRRVESRDATAKYCVLLLFRGIASYQRSIHGCMRRFSMKIQMRTGTANHHKPTPEKELCTTLGNEL